MFESCIHFNCDLSNWDIRNVEYMNYMFWHCKNFKCDLSKWDVYCGDEMYHAFQYCPLEKHPELQPNIIFDK